MEEFQFKSCNFTKHLIAVFKICILKLLFLKLYDLKPQNPMDASSLNPIKTFSLWKNLFYIILCKKDVIEGKLSDFSGWILAKHQRR